MSNVCSPVSELQKGEGLRHRSGVNYNARDSQ